MFMLHVVDSGSKEEVEEENYFAVAAAPRNLPKCYQREGDTQHDES